MGNGIKRTTNTGQQFSACFLFIHLERGNQDPEMEGGFARNQATELNVKRGVRGKDT